VKLLLVPYLRQKILTGLKVAKAPRLNSITDVPFVVAPSGKIIIGGKYLSFLISSQRFTMQSIAFSLSIEFSLVKKTLYKARTMIPKKGVFATPSYDKALGQYFVDNI